jgi:hypothetical protein
MTENTSDAIAGPSELATPDGTVSVSDQSSVSPDPDASEVYFSISFERVDRDLADQVIDTVRSVVGRNKSFSVSFGQAI